MNPQQASTVLGNFGLSGSTATPYPTAPNSYPQQGGQGTTPAGASPLSGPNGVNVSIGASGRWIIWGTAGILAVAFLIYVVKK